MGYRWREIEDYNVDPNSLARQELKALAVVWREQRAELERLDAFQQFIDNLKREWAIETGLIERLYGFDHDIAQRLIGNGLNEALVPHGAVENLDAAILLIKDQKIVLENIFEFITDDRELTVSYIKEIQAMFTWHQGDPKQTNFMGQQVTIPLIKGDYKHLPNNPLRPDGELHEYCPPEHVSSEMDRLMAMHHEHRDVPAEVEAAWLHHRFTQIHPFQDGNGRVARALATLILVRAGWLPLVVRNKERDIYFDALEAADDGDLIPLVTYFSDLQKDELIRALSIARDALEYTRAEDVICAMRRQLQRREDSFAVEWQAAYQTADLLCKKAQRRLCDVSKVMQQEVRGLVGHAEFSADGANNRDSNNHYFRSQIIGTAKNLGYFANMHTYRSWARLVMNNVNRSELLIAFHGVGHEFRGVLACSACWFQRAETEGRDEIFDVRPMTDRVFQINYREPVEQAEERFLPWLEECIVRAIEHWQVTAL